jgi:hypothetical protein
MWLMNIFGKSKTVVSPASIKYVEPETFDERPVVRKVDGCCIGYVKIPIPFLSNQYRCARVVDGSRTGKTVVVRLSCNLSHDQKHRLKKYRRRPVGEVCY